MRLINLPIHIEVENNKVFAIWYDDGNGQDHILFEGEDYSVEYRTVPKNQAGRQKPYGRSNNWLRTKNYKDWEKEENEE